MSACKLWALTIGLFSPGYTGCCKAYQAQIVSTCCEDDQIKITVHVLHLCANVLGTVSRAGDKLEVVDGRTKGPVQDLHI